MPQKDPFYQEHTKILVPMYMYKLMNDPRLLIPFTSGENIGFFNNKCEVVIEPKYAMYYGECINKHDYIKVACICPYGFTRKSGEVAAYKRPLYGIINHKGEEVIPVKYFNIGLSDSKEVITVQGTDCKYAVLSIIGREIVPFGKYSWIDSFSTGDFDRDFARVKIKDTDGKFKWGIIDDTGKVIVPVEYDNIWNFKNRKQTNTILEKSGTQLVFDFLNKTITKRQKYSDGMECQDIWENIPGWDSYDEYGGYNGYDDFTIDSAFDGDPDATWNID